MNAQVQAPAPDGEPGDAANLHADPADAAEACENLDEHVPAAGPIDADWARHEQAAQGLPAQPVGEDDDPYGDPTTVTDEGELESLGEAVSDWVEDGFAGPHP